VASKNYYYSDSEKEQARDLYVKRELSFEQVARAQGIPRRTLSKWSKEAIELDGLSWPQARARYSTTVTQEQDQLDAKKQANENSKTDAFIISWRNKIDVAVLSVHMGAIAANAKLIKEEKDPTRIRIIVDSTNMAYSTAKPLLETDDDSKATRKRLEIVVVQEAIEKPQEVKDIESALTGTDDERST